MVRRDMVERRLQIVINLVPAHEGTERAARLLEQKRLSVDERAFPN